MKSQTIKLLWILISITLFVIAITGTLLLVLTDASHIGTAHIKEKATLTQKEDNLHSDEELGTPLNIQEATPLTIQAPNDPQDIQIPLNDDGVKSIYNPIGQQNNQAQEDSTEVDSHQMAQKEETPKARIVSDDKRTVATIVEKKVATTPSVSATPANTQTITKPVQTVTPTKNTVQKVATKVTNQAVKKAFVPSPKKEKSVTKYWVQVASYTIISSAQNAKEDLKKDGIESIITTKVLDGKTHYRLRIGSFDSKEEADKFLPTVQSIKGYEKAYVSKTISFLSK